MLAGEREVRMKPYTLSLAQSRRVDGAGVGLIHQECRSSASAVQQSLAVTGRGGAARCQFQLDQHDSQLLHADCGWDKDRKCTRKG